MRSLALGAVAVMLAAGCGKSKKRPPAAEPIAAVHDAAVSDAAPADARPRERAVVTVTPRMRRDFARALAEGRRLEQAKAYADASAAFEAALKVIPDHPTALSELSWSAYMTGDLATARAASTASARAATDPHVKAASLYNLGRVLEDEGKKDDAIAAYRESLQLRSNTVVAKRVAALGAAAPGTIAARPPCAERRPLAEVCTCLEAAVRARGGLESEETLRCAPFGEVTQGVRAWRVESGNAEDFADDAATDTLATYFLAHVTSASAGIVAELGRDLIHNAITSDGVETMRVDVDVQTAGGKQVLWVTAIRAFEFEDDWELRETHTRTLWLCREDGGEFACPIQVPVKHYFLHDVAEGADRDAFIETYRAAPPIKRAFQLDVDVGNDGAVTVIRAQGDKSDTALYVGRQRLW